MPPSKATFAMLHESAETGETAYASATTRVIRLQGISAPDRCVYKKYLGPQAKARLVLERDMLLRLAGIEGVVQLAKMPCPPDTLALEDCGGISVAQSLRAGRWELATVLSVAIGLA